jgi:hypothetical protein
MHADANNKPWAIGLQWSLRSLIGFSGLATTIANKHTGRRFHGVCPSPSLQLSAQQASITDTGRHAGGTHAQIVRCDSSSSQGLLRDTHRLWAGGVAAIEANAKAAQFRKGAHLRHQTHCKYGHSLADAYISRQQGGYIKRDCRTCWAIRQKRPGIMRPEVAKKVEAILRTGAPISRFTKGGTKSYLVQHKTFTRFRYENPHIDQLVLSNLRDENSRDQLLRWQRVRNATVRDQNNDYYKILAMLPANFPGRDDVVGDIFEALLNGSPAAPGRSDVREALCRRTQSPVPNELCEVRRGPVGFP